MLSAEEYLIQVLRPGNPSKTFDELRYWMYHHGKTFSVTELPPTSESIRLHILRAFFIVYNQNNCLEEKTTSLDPLLFGYKMENDGLILKSVDIFPSTEELVPNCNCGKCAQKRSCCCRAAGLPCSSFCHCQTTSQCTNPYNL